MGGGGVSAEAVRRFTMNLESDSRTSRDVVGLLRV